MYKEINIEVKNNKDTPLAESVFMFGVFLRTVLIYGESFTKIIIYKKTIIRRTWCCSAIVLPIPSKSSIIGARKK